MPQPMQNLEDSSDPTTAMNKALALIAKAFKINTIPTNNNQRSSLIPRNNQIAQPDMNTCQDIKMQMVLLNVEITWRIKNAVQNDRNEVRQNAVQNPDCSKGEEARIQITQEEFEFMAAADAHEETERVKVNCTSEDTLQQASTSGTQYDNALIYDSDGSTEDLTAAAKNHFMELNELTELRDEAYENTRIYKERSKRWHDVGDMNFKVGDKESRFKRFLDNKLEDGEKIWNSIQNGSYKRPVIPNPNNDQEMILESLSKMTEGNKKQYIADVKVMNYLLQAIPNDIYNSVDACKNAKDMWERVKRLMFGYDVTTHVRHSRLMDEFDKFAAKEGESLESVYERLTTLLNIMDRNNVRPIPVSINTKFLNCLQSEWRKYVTMVCHNQIGGTVSYDVLYDSLVQSEPHVLASKAKKVAKNHDPFSLLAHFNCFFITSNANFLFFYSPQHTM
ncbi:hypothetical protein Tco_1293173 [Tanacetum coccineum]